MLSVPGLPGSVGVLLREADGSRANGLERLAALRDLRVWAEAQQLHEIDELARGGRPVTVADLRRAGLNEVRARVLAEMIAARGSFVIPRQDPPQTPGDHG